MASNQYRLLLSLLSAKDRPIDTGRHTLAAAKAIACRALSFLSKPCANEVLIFGKGLFSLHSTIVVTNTSSWKAQLKLLLSGVPFEKVACTDLSPLAKMQDRLMLDQTESLKVYSTGNDTLVFSSQVNHTKAIIYWGNTSKGCESIRRQKHGLERATLHFQLSHQRIPKILTYREIDQNEICFQITEISHQTELKRPTNDSSNWVEAVSLANCSLEMFPTSTITSDFASRLLRNVAPAFAVTETPIRQLEEAMLNWQKISTPMNTPIHGDLWHSNALYDKERRPCGIIDWEWYSDFGVKGFDAIHCLIVSFAVFNGISTFEVIRKTLTKDVSVAPLLRAFEHFVDTGRLKEHDINPIICLAWLMIVYRSQICTGPQNMKWLSDATLETMPFALDALFN